MPPRRASRRAPARASSTPRSLAARTSAPADVVRLAERHARGRQVVGDLGRDQVALVDRARASARRRTSAPAISPAIVRSARERGLDRVVERLLRLLQILVVGERQPLDHREQRDPGRRRRGRPWRAPARATSGFTFCGMIDEPEQYASRQPHEAELLRRPQHQLLAEPRQVRLHERARARPARPRSRDRRPRRAMLRVTPSKPSARAVALAIDREAWSPASAPEPSGDSSARRAASAMPPAIAREHRVVGEQVMREPHRLRALQVRVARAAACRRARAPARRARARSAVDRRRSARAACVARVEPQIGRDLIVAAARRCAAARPASPIELGQPRLDVHVHVLELRVERELAALPLGDAPGRGRAQIASASAAGKMPCAASIRACALEPSTS